MGGKMHFFGKFGVFFGLQKSQFSVYPLRMRRGCVCQNERGGVPITVNLWGLGLYEPI